MFEPYPVRPETIFRGGTADLTATPGRRRRVVQTRIFFTACSSEASLLSSPEVTPFGLDFRLRSNVLSSPFDGRGVRAEEGTYILSFDAAHQGQC